MDLSALMTFHTSSLELMVRGTLMYWFLFLVFRFVLRRDTGAVGLADILFIVIVADASQNGMSGSYDTVAEGFVLVGTLVFWNVLLDWTSYRFAFMRRLTEPPPLLLIRNGRILARNLRQEFLTRADLDAKLREAGVASIAQVHKAFMESDGQFSVLTDQDVKKKRPDSTGMPGT